MLSEEFVNGYKDRQVPWGFGLLSEVVYSRTYARIKDDGTKEQWYETVARCVNGAEEIGADYTQDEMERLYDYMFHLKVLPGGRFLWQLGTNTVRKHGANSLLNCMFVALRKPDDFVFLFNCLLLGTGAGVSVRRADIGELPRIKRGVTVAHSDTKDADFHTSDSREGWCRLLREVLTAFFKTGESFTYSTLLVRGAGEPIKGFGGVASGARPLVQGMQEIVKILQSREGKKLRSVDALDICTIIGTIVKAGNIRRSAILMCADPDDILYLRAKRWDLGGVPNWRASSNNSIYADTYDQLLPDFWDTYTVAGEPIGLVNIKLAQTQGRLGEYQEDHCEGVNACSESVLEPYEFCDLGELFLNNITSQEEMLDCTKLIYKMLKAATQMKFIDKQSEEVEHRNARIGIGITGVCQSFHKLDWLDPTYRALKAFDAEWSAYKGWNKSIKLSLAKPSGTISLLAGATPGVHPAYAQYYIRRVRMASNDVLVDYCRTQGLTVEYERRFDGSINRDQVVVEFPCFAGDNVITADQMGPIKQLELVKLLQTLWADQSISVTVYYNDDTFADIQAWLQDNYETSLKTVSFLKHSGHGFDQAPYEEITKEQYLEMIDHVELTSMFHAASSEMLELDECATNGCPIR